MTLVEFMNKLKLEIAMILKLEWKRFFLTFVLCIYGFITVYGILDETTVLNCISYLFLGIKPTFFQPNDFKIFKIPYTWLTLFVHIFFSVGSLRSLQWETYNQKNFMSFHNRSHWWLFQNMKVAIQVFIHYVVIFASGIVFVLIVNKGEFLFSLSTGFKEAFLDIADVDLDMIVVIVIMFALFITICLAVCELLFIHLFDSIVAYIFLLIYLVFSSFFSSNFLLGNYLMILRSNQLTADGVDMMTGLFFACTVVISSILIGIYWVKRLDYF